MAMEEPLYMIMNFNPFRSTSHQQEAAPPTRPPQPQRLDTSDDSWHTNAPQHINNNHQYNNNHNPHPPPSYKSSTALSWLQSWATSSSTTTTTIHSPQHTSVSSSSIIVTHSDGTKHQHSTSTPPISHPPPAKSITMIRGTGNSCSPTSEEYTKEELEEIDNVIKNTIPPLPLQNTTTEDGDCSVDLHHDLPPYPQPRSAPKAHTIDSTPRVVNKPLLEDFPQSKVTLQNSRREASNTSAQNQIIHPKEETTFPGFTLYQTAKQQYVQGQYSKALDTTTNCLSFQQLALKSGTHAATAAVQQAVKEVDISPTNTSIPNLNNNADMTPLDMRSHFATSVGSSVLNAVQSLKTADSPNRIRHKQHTHPILSNNISNLISKYPLHPCVAQTLLLRAHVLAACSNDDHDLLMQSIQHVEMAVAMFRKLVIIDEELARPLIYFAKLKTQLGQYSEADLAYTEAIKILQTVRMKVKRSLKHALQTEGEDSDLIAECNQYLQQINDEVAHALYLQGKSYQCQQMYAQAFDYYNQALKLYNKSSASYKRNSLKVKCIARCMRSRSALEKRVSSYWDDTNII